MVKTLIHGEDCKDGLIQYYEETDFQVEQIPIKCELVKKHGHK
jgi:hypothetical protein